MIHNVCKPPHLSRASQALIRKAFRFSFQRNLATQTFSAVHLKSRSLIKLEGPDSLPLLQGLITNDVSHLASRSAIYSIFLNNQGRVLYDSIIYKTKRYGTLVECDTTVKVNLIKHIKTFRLRKKVEVIDASEETADPLDIWVVFDRSPGTTKDTPVVKFDSNFKSTPDPRMPSLGRRLIVPRGSNNLFTESPSDDIAYTQLRYALGVAEGAKELPSGTCFPLESNADYLHGVSFHKGCYIGQELTARTYHTGVIRKRIMPIRFLEDHQLSDIDPEALTLVNEATGKSVGKIRGISGSFGIGLVRVEAALEAQSIAIVYENQTVPVIIEKPFWWPIEASQANPDKL